MSKKDYVAIARTISHCLNANKGDDKACDAIKQVAIELSLQAFKPDNKAFNTDTFMIAAGCYTVADL